jgi:hypothetical protein
MRHVLAVTVMLLGLPGCKKPATAEESFQRLERSVAAGDAAEFYRCLDAPTRSAIADTLSEERLQRTIIQAKFPEAEAGPALAKLKAAEHDDPLKYFVAVNDERKTVQAFRKRLGSVSGPIMKKPEGDKMMWLARKDGMPFRFARQSDGSWGFNELLHEWGLEKDRAQHAVKTVRDNAALYQKAGTP